MKKMQLIVDADFTIRIEFQALFTGEGEVSTQSIYMWSPINTRITVSSKVQHKFSINIWAGILGIHL